MLTKSELHGPINFFERQLFFCQDICVHAQTPSHLQPTVWWYYHLVAVMGCPSFHGGEHGKGILHQECLQLRVQHWVHQGIPVVYLTGSTKTRCIQRPMEYHPNHSRLEENFTLQPKYPTNSLASCCSCCKTQDQMLLSIEQTVQEDFELIFLDHEAAAIHARLLGRIHKETRNLLHPTSQEATRYET